MKFIFTLFILALAYSASAQWSNTTNDFYDSLHMSVCTATGQQQNPIVVKSFPDNGYFVLWEDQRRGFGSNKQLFAQKYDENGNQLWADNGVPVSAGTNNQHYTYSSNTDLRIYSVAATDSAGGFYIGYADDSISSYVWERLIVQHIQSDGSAVFPGAGYIIFTSNYPNWPLSPQLIADGNKGFFIGYSIGGGGYSDIYVYCYKDNNGTMQYFGGGQMDINAYAKPLGSCANYTIDFRDAFVYDYMIYSDLQKGCNVTMTMAQNAGGNERAYTGYNWLWRVKENSTAPSIDPDQPMISYIKDSVITFYKVFYHTYRFQCGNEIGEGYILDGNGYYQSSNEVYGAEHTKATLIPTDGNINVDIMAVNERRYLNSTVTDWFTHAIYRIQQKFDSIPYEYTVGPYYRPGFVGGPPPGQNKLGSYSGNNNDTLLYDPGTSYFYNFNLASGGNKVYATGMLLNALRDVVLQGLELQKITPDSFAVLLSTGNKNGIVIGKENISTYYNTPMITVDNNGNALFYIHDQRRPVRVSPIGNGAELTWGAMGKPIGDFGPFSTWPYVVMDSQNGTAVLSWYEEKTLPTGTGNNIYMRHLDSLNVTGYIPPYKLVNRLANGPTPAYPSVLLGTSKQYSTIEINGSPVVAILDNYNLGNVTVSVYQNSGPIRTYDGNPYIDRNYGISPENNPTGPDSINIRLFFTEAEFEALKAANPSILSPGDLAVIKQPGTGYAPASYIFATGEQTVLPQSWAAVPGGYYIEIAITGFSNFFIFKNAAVKPITKLGIQAQQFNNAEAKVIWQVAGQRKVKEYIVQESADGNVYSDACTIKASNQTGYSCIVPANPNVKNYYRVLERDIDGRKMYSKIAMLQFNTNSEIIIHPNPVKDVLRIANVIGYSELQITDITGRIMLEQKVSSANPSVNVVQLRPGTYFLKLKGNDVQTLKFVKE